MLTPRGVISIEEDDTEEDETEDDSEINISDTEVEEVDQQQTNGGVSPVKKRKIESTTCEFDCMVEKF